MYLRSRSILIALFMIISMSIVGCARPIAPANPSENKTDIQPDSSISPETSPSFTIEPYGDETPISATPSENKTNIQPDSSISPETNPSFETFEDETHKHIQYGSLSFTIDEYHHIVSHTRDDHTETFICEVDQDVYWDPPHTVTMIVIREMETQHFPGIESIVAYLRDLSPNYEKIVIYHEVTDDSGIIGLYSVTGDGLTNYIVCYEDAWYFIESDYSVLAFDLFANYPYPQADYEEERKIIECAGSFVTHVNQTVYYQEDQFDNAEYEIIQGKDGTKYSAQLIFEDGKYQFTLQNENGVNLLPLSTYGEFYDVLAFIDANMDGYADVQFLESPGAMNNSYNIYIWDDTAQNFVKANCDEMLSYIEVRDGYLWNWQQESAGSGVIQKFTWDKNTMIKVSEEPYQAE